MASCDKMLPVLDSLLLKIKKPNKYQICVMDLVSHRGITHIVWKACDKLVCLFEIYLFVLFHWMA